MQAMLANESQPDAGPRFAFGRNWAAFLETLNDERIARSRAALVDLVGRSDLSGLRFLDIGCGSGLFSLAAAGLGAATHSFDYDPDSVACTEHLRERFGQPGWGWHIERGSILDADYVRALGKWDIVYSWGVLHHTGRMWEALENAAGMVAPGGTLAIAIYNDEGPTSRRWTTVKRNYVRRPWLRPFLAVGSLAVCWGPTLARDSLRLAPLATWNAYAAERGMSAWHDLIDWVGGYPFEVATPDAIFDFCRKRGFTLERLITRQGKGCNEFCLRLQDRSTS